MLLTNSGEWTQVWLDRWNRAVVPIAPDRCDGSVSHQLPFGLKMYCKDAVSVLNQAIENRDLDVEETSRLPIAVTDNCLQFIAKAFAMAREGLRFEHQCVPVKTPNMRPSLVLSHYP